MYDHFKSNIRIFVVIFINSIAVTSVFSESVVSKSSLFLQAKYLEDVIVLTQEMINKENKTYTIKYDYDLKGKKITVPKGCVLDFQGGSFCNGTLIGTYTCIQSPVRVIFKNIDIQGTWNVPDIYIDWMALNGDEEDNMCEIRSVLRLQSDDVYNTIYFPNRKISYFPTQETNSLIDLSSNTHLIIPNTIKVLPNNLMSYKVVNVTYKQRIIIDGGGTIIGDVDDHTYIDGSTSEWGFGIHCYAAKKVVINNIDCSHFIGDGIYLGGGQESELGCFNNACDGINIDNVNCFYNRRQGMSVIHCKNLEVKNSNFSYTGNIEFTAPGCGIDFEPNYDTQGFENILFEDCSMVGNRYADVKFYSRYYNKNIHFNRCNFDNLEGKIKVVGVDFSVGDFKDISFNHCTFNSGISFTKSKSNNYISNVTFNNCTIMGGLMQWQAKTEYPIAYNVEFKYCDFIVPDIETKTNNHFIYIRNNAAKYVFRNCQFRRKGNKNFTYVWSCIPYPSLKAYNCSFNINHLPSIFEELSNCVVRINIAYRITIPYRENVLWSKNTFIAANGMESFGLIYFLNNTDFPISENRFTIIKNTFKGRVKNLFSVASGSNKFNTFINFIDNDFTGIQLNNIEANIINALSNTAVLNIDK